MLNLLYRLMTDYSLSAFSSLYFERDSFSSLLRVIDYNSFLFNRFDKGTAEGLVKLKLLWG